MPGAIAAPGPESPTRRAPVGGPRASPSLAMTALLLAASGLFARGRRLGGPRRIRLAPPRVFLPAADASASPGATRPTIRDAFLGADALGAMLVRAPVRRRPPRGPRRAHPVRARGPRRPPRPRPGMDGERREVFGRCARRRRRPGLIFPPLRLSRRLRPAHRRGAERVEARPRPGRAVRPGHARVARGTARVRGRSRATRPPEARRPPRVRHRGVLPSRRGRGREPRPLPRLRSPRE